MAAATAAGSVDSPTPRVPLACTTASTSWVGGHLDLEDRESSVRVPWVEVPWVEDHMVGAHPEVAPSLAEVLAAPTSHCIPNAHLVVVTSSRHRQVLCRAAARHSLSAVTQGSPAVSS